MNILEGINNFFSGVFFKEIKDTVMTYLPPSMGEREKAEFELKFTREMHQREMEANRVLHDASKQLDQRISQQEGTAKDLRALPVVGRLVLFLRGTQRPLWGFITMYLDYQWFLGPVEFDERQSTGMIVINLLVLGFLFGERTVKNLEPLIMTVFGKK